MITKVKNNMPTRKVGVGALAGALTGLIIWGVHSFSGVTIDADTAVYLSTVVTFFAQYFTKDSQ